MKSKNKLKIKSKKINKKLYQNTKKHKTYKKTESNNIHLSGGFVWNTNKILFLENLLRLEDNQLIDVYNKFNVPNKLSKKEVYDIIGKEYTLIFMDKNNKSSTKVAKLSNSKSFTHKIIKTLIIPNPPPININIQNNQIIPPETISTIKTHIRSKLSKLKQRERISEVYDLASTVI